MREILFRGKFGNEWKYGFLSIEPKGLIYKVQRNKRCFINRSCEETLICLYLQTFSQEGGGKRGTAK